MYLLDSSTDGASRIFIKHIFFPFTSLDYNGFVIAAPNQYNIPDVLTSSYDSNMKTSPSYTIRPKTAVWADKTQKPGPGTHCPEKVSHNHRSSSESKVEFIYTM